MTILRGIVTKAGVMEKTVTVTVERKVLHPKLLKEISQHKKYLVHDPNSSAKIGQRVTIELGRPVSARKSFWLKEVEGGIKEQVAKDAFVKRS